MYEIIGSSIMETLVGAALEKWHQNKIKEIQSIILKEITEKGSSICVEHEDDAITLIEMFLNAQRLGAANENLQFMARALKNLALTREPIYPDRFRKYARILSELTYEEIITICYFYNTKRKITDENAMLPFPVTILGNNLWERVKSEASVNCQIPIETLQASAFACQRFGLLIPDQTLDGMGHLMPTKLLDEIVELSEMV